ncbi:MAG: hypothetical protein ABIE22_00840 [archaeon]
MKKWKIALIIIIILVILVVFSIFFRDRLTSYVVFNFDEGCRVEEPLFCQSYSFSSSGLGFKLENTGEQSIEINKIDVDGCGAKVYEVAPLEILPGNVSEGLVFTCVLKSELDYDIQIFTGEGTLQGKIKAS